MEGRNRRESLLDTTNTHADGTRETAMWIIFGIGTILATILNIVMTVKHKEAGCCRFASMSLTALTVCAFYFEAAQRVINAEWGALMDIMPYMSKTLWICVLISIFVNSISLIKPSR